MDANGLVLWQKTLGGSDRDVVHDICPTPDGGCVVTCYSQSVNADLQGITATFTGWVVKFNIAGIIQWQKFYPGNPSPFTVTRTPDNGYLITGRYYVSSTSSHVFLQKLNNNGSLLWEKKLVKGQSSFCADLQLTADGGMIIVGAVYNQGPGQDCWIIKLDANRETVWELVLSTPNWESVHEVLEVPDGYLVAGNTDSNTGIFGGNHGLFDIYLFKISKTGELIWAKNYGGSEDETLGQMELLNNGDILFCGSTRSDDYDVSFKLGYEDIWLFKTNEKGELLWETTFGGEGSESAKAGIFAHDGGFIMAGNTSSTGGFIDGFHGGFEDLWIMKTTPID